MSRPAFSFLPAGPVVFLLALAGCEKPATMGAGQPSQARVDAATMEACRQRANEIYDKQNRPAIYAPQYGVNNPMSGNYTPGLERGLSAEFGYQQMLQECIRNAGVARDMPQSPSSSGSPVSGATGTLPGAKAPPPPSAR
jgi:hypothetical protein